MPGFVRNIEPKIREGLDARVDAMAKRGNEGTALRSGLLEPTTTTENYTLTQEAQVVKSPFVRMMSPGKVKTHVLYGMFNLDDIPGSDMGTGDVDFFETLQSRVQGAEQSFYGTRGDDDANLDSNYLKPKPGISNVNIVYANFGGAIRKATVKWTCWTLDQLAMYQKGSFLSTGRNIILDWGWVRGEKGTEQVPKILTSAADGSGVKLDENLFMIEYDDDKKTKKSKSAWDKLYLTYHGDWSGLIGTVAKFDWEMRDDGGFDCTTELLARGTNIFSKPMKPPQSELGSTVPMVAPTFSEAMKDIANNITDGDEADTLASFANVPKLNITERIAALDIELISKYFSTEEIWTQLTEKDPYRVEVSTDKCIVAILRAADKDAEGGVLLTQPKEASTDGETKEAEGIERAKNFSSDIWIRWGWFEDNIVSYYASHAKTGEGDQRTAEFRSIASGGDGKPLTSVIIKNNKELLTHDPSIFVLPGQYNPEYHPDHLAMQPNEGGGGYTADFNYKQLADAFQKVSPFTVNDTMESGYLRNIFVNLTQIQSCFSSPGASIQSAMLKLANKLNVGVPIWKFEVNQVDDLSSAKATYFIDEVSTPPTKEDTDDGIDNDPKTSYVFENYGYNSIVKDISMSCTIPDKFATSAGLGAVREEESEKFSNTDPIKAFFAPQEPKTEDEEAVQVLAAFMADKGNESVISNVQGKLGSNDKFGGSNKDDGQMDAKDEKELRDNALEGAKWNHTISETLVNITPTAKVSYAQQFMDKYMDSLKTQEGVIGETIDGVPPNVTQTASSAFHMLKDDPNAAIEFAKPYDMEGKLRPHYLKTMKWYLVDNPLSPVGNTNKTLLLPISLDMTIEGCAGLFPGNMFRLAYLPKEYGQTGLDEEHSAKTYFSIMGISHTIDQGTWSTQIEAILNKVPSMEKAGVVEGTEESRIAAKRAMLDKVNDAYEKAVEKFKVPQPKAAAQAAS